MTSLPQPKPSRFASGATEKLPLSDGDWILVHRELSYSQQRRLASAGLSGIPQVLSELGGGGGLSVDLAAFDIEKLVTWVMDWSFRDGDGNQVVVSRESIEGLTVETAEEINAALSEYIAEADAKKSPGGWWADQTRSDLVLCLRFGWTWDELMRTPAPVVAQAVALLNEAADSPSTPPPGAIEWPADEEDARMASQAELQILITASDAASAQLRAIGQDVQRLERQVEGVQRTTRASGGLLGGLSLGAGFQAAQQALQGLGGLVDLVKSSVFDLNAALERNVATFEQVTGSVAAAQSVVAALRREAASSPFSDAETLAAGRALITVADGSTESLVHLVRVAEELAAVDPAQGLEGASQALREAVSGDFQSIAERFELSRQAIQKFRDSGMTNLQAVEAELARLGVTSEIVERMGRTFEGRQATIVSFFDELRQRLGSGIFDRVAELFGHMVNLIAEHGDRLRQIASDVGQAIGAILERVAAATTGPLRALLDTFAPGLWASIQQELSRIPEAVEQTTRAAQEAVPVVQSLERQLAGIGVSATEVQQEAGRVKDVYDAQLEPLERQLRLLQQSADLQRVQNALATNRATVEGLRLDREITALQAAAGGATDPNQAGLTTRQRMIALALQERQLRKEELGLTEEQRPAVQTLQERIAAVQEQQRQALQPLQDQLKAYRDQADALQLQRDKAALLKQDMEAAAAAARKVWVGDNDPAAVESARQRGEELAASWLKGYEDWIKAGGGTVWGAIGKSLTDWYEAAGKPLATRLGADLGGALGGAASGAFEAAFGPRLQAIERFVAIMDEITATFTQSAAGRGVDPLVHEARRRRIAGLPRVSPEATGPNQLTGGGAPAVQVGDVTVTVAGGVSDPDLAVRLKQALTDFLSAFVLSGMGTDPGARPPLQGAGR